MLRRLIAVLPFAIALVPSLAPAAGPDPLPPFACTGPFAADTDEAALIRTFGRANVVFRSVPAAEGEMVKASVLFPDDPARRVEIIWLDEKKRRRPGDVIVYNPGPWRTAEGIGIGATLAEVEAANGKPFTLSGFGWDYGGSVLDWDGGRLAKSTGCRLQLRFEPTAAYQGDVDGDREFRSDNKDMRAAKPVVYQMLLSYGGE
ncbi:hypothetical protein V5F29_06630 [Xanthobacter aminoxidans]|uniref:hypothetical protein n=1 Tax=Xanthobacter aminoxidans TaxID=186280 RepID=UPI00372ACDCD